VEFELDRDVESAAQDVRDKVSTIRRDLPDDVEAPVIEKLDPDASPIIAVGLVGERSIRDLTEFADDVVKERLERVRASARWKSWAGGNAKSEFGSRWTG